MIRVEEATQIVLAHARPADVCIVPLEQAPGHVLRQSIRADRDFPPFHRVAMDGVAIRYSAFSEGRRKFAIHGRSPAGVPPATLPHPAACIEVATGAVLPVGTDTVVPYEDLDIVEKTAVMKIESIRFQQNVHPQGMDCRANDTLISPGLRIGAAEMAILATVGQTLVQVSKPPKTAIIATGDELVDISHTPLPWQIRQSNVFALQTLLDSRQIKSKFFYSGDNFESMKILVAEILAEYDLVLFSGGVSAGKKDFVPEILKVSGVQTLFHKVAQRPGKPLLFGQNSAGATVFALPGNPVSAFLCACLYVIPWISQHLGLGDVPEEWALLSETQTFKPDLTWFLPVSVENQKGIMRARAHPGHGSGDLANLHLADGFLELPQGQNVFGTAEPYRLIRWRP